MDFLIDDLSRLVGLPCGLGGMGRRQNSLDVGEREGGGGYGDEGGVECALTFGGGWKKL